MRRFNMNKTRLFCSIGLMILSILLIVVAATSKAATSNVEKKNLSLMDPRVPTQFVPMKALSMGESTGYEFIDRTSIKLHPYNANIRTFYIYSNYEPELQQSHNGELIPYRAMVQEKFVNCDKKLWATKSIDTYDVYFGEGNLLTHNETPQRWVTANDSQQQNMLLIACSLPVNQ